MDCGPPGSSIHGQEYWSGLPFPSPGDSPDPGSNLCLLHWEADSLLPEPPGKPSEEVMKVKWGREGGTLIHLTDVHVLTSGHTY